MLRHRADEPHAAGNAVEFRREKSALAEDEVGPDDARHVRLEAILAADAHDLFGLAAVQVVGDERRRRAACAALVERRERFIEGEEIGSQPLDRTERLGREPEGFGGQSPSNLGLVDPDAAEESGGHVFVEVARLVARGHAGDQRGTGHLARLPAKLESTLCDFGARERDVAASHGFPDRGRGLGVAPTSA